MPALARNVDKGMDPAPFGIKYPITKEATSSFEISEKYLASISSC